ncbi:hypothetical protein RP20_CCG017460 [Aedes albopictus]|nr:hypothetical protein RP20_CCG017460 [Aedes albopictus]
MALITLPVSRSFNVLLNALFGRWSIRVLVFYLEKIKVLHLFFGVGLIIVGVIHTIAHFINIVNFVDNYDAKFDAINWASGKDDAWIWPLIGLSIYVLDVTIRYLTAHSDRQKISTLQSYVLPANGVYLRLRFTSSKRIVISAGQYVLLQCPAISTIEWHPFTVVDFPTAIHNTVSLTVAVRGDWTQRLYDLVSEKERLKQSGTGIDALGKVQFLLDGPYPSAMTGMLKCKRMVYIGAGVGITPFAGFVRHLLNFNTDRPTRIHLIWIVRKAEMFTWFADELTKLQERFWKQNKPDRFTLKLFLTRNYNTSIIDEYFGDYPTLKARISKGRPDWDEVFLDLATLYAGKSVNVFSCGPKGLTKDIRGICRQYRKHSCKFIHLHEGFG